MGKPSACDCEMIAILTCTLSSFLANLAYLTAPFSCSAFLHEFITASVFSIIFQCIYVEIKKLNKNILGRINLKLLWQGTLHKAPLNQSL